MNILTSVDTCVLLHLEARVPGMWETTNYSNWNQNNVVIAIVIFRIDKDDAFLLALIVCNSNHMNDKSRFRILKFSFELFQLILNSWHLSSDYKGIAKSNANQKSNSQLFQDHCHLYCDFSDTDNTIL